MITYGDGLVTRKGSLVELGESHGVPQDGGVAIELNLSQTELAAAVGASREAVGRALRMLREASVLQTRRRGMTILDLEALRTRAGAGGKW